MTRRTAITLPDVHVDRERDTLRPEQESDALRMAQLFVDLPALDRAVLLEIAEVLRSKPLHGNGRMAWFLTVTVGEAENSRMNPEREQ